MKKLIAAMFFLAVLLSGCTSNQAPDPASTNPTQATTQGATQGSTQTQTESAKDTLTFTGYNLNTFNIFQTGTLADFYFDGSIIGESLVTVKNDFTFEPQLCERYEVSADGTVYTFYIRPNVTFHNGQPLTVADVIYSLNKSVEAANGAELKAIIKEVKGIGDTAVEITLNAPSVSFLVTLSVYNAIVPNGIFESDYDWEAHPIGTGAYEFVSYLPGDRLVLRAYDGYYDQSLPKIENVVYRIISDTSTRAIALETGQLDFYFTDSSGYASLKDNPDIGFISYPGTNATFAYMDTTVAPFDDLNVRLALNHAINRQALAKMMGEEMYVPAVSFASPAVLGFSNPSGYDFDIELAKSYISQSKYSDSELSFTITTTSSMQSVAAFMQESFRSIGVDNVVIDIVDGGSFGASMMAREYAFGLTGFGGGNVAAANSVLFQTGAPFNVMNYSNPQVDALYAQVSAITDIGEGMEYYTKIDKLIQDDAPLINLYWSNQILAYNKSLVPDEAVEYTCGSIFVSLKHLYFK